MFVVRFLVLAFLSAYCIAMGRIPSYELNAFGKMMAFLGIVFVPLMYMLPTIEAKLKRHPNIVSIALVNLFLGWSLIGWVVALVWAFKKQEPVPVKSAQAFEASPAVSTSRKTKTCPYCAEEILAAAVKCKHCGSEVPAA